MVTILALAAAVLYGTADFLGGVASRRASVVAVLAMTVPAGAVVVVAVALLGEAPWLGGLLGHGLGSPTSFGGWGAVGWAVASGVCGSSGLIAFYAGFAAARSAWWLRSPRSSPRSCPWAWRSPAANGSPPA